MGVPYEYSSIMHYGITAFSVDGNSQTIRSKYPSREKEIGRVYLKELAYSDIQIVNKMYKCSDHCPDQNKCGVKGHLDQNCNCICEDGSSDCDTSKLMTSDPACANFFDNWRCYIWANQGECDSNPRFMRHNCAKACGLCGDSETKDTCNNTYVEKKCEMWKSRGDCITNRAWMKKHCPVTCNLCTDGGSRPEESCVNRKKDVAKCDDWARKGECVINLLGMFTHCQKSCGYCNETEDSLLAAVTNEDVNVVQHDSMECVNTHNMCESWASSGECEHNPDYMIRNCRKACKKCDDGTCKNLFDDSNCDTWARSGECLTNTKWMPKHCAKSCNTGPCEGHHDNRPTARPIETTPKGPTICKNEHSSDSECKAWADYGECINNANWMERNCAKAWCTGVCAGRDTDVEPDDAGCFDDNEACQDWAAAGYCNGGNAYVLRHCTKSCNICNGCRDTSPSCGIWAKAGHCDSNAGYMIRECQKSCNVCPP